MKQTKTKAHPKVILREKFTIVNSFFKERKKKKTSLK